MWFFSSLSSLTFILVDYSELTSADFAVVFILSHCVDWLLFTKLWKHEFLSFWNAWLTYAAILTRFAYRKKYYARQQKILSINSRNVIFSFVNMSISSTLKTWHEHRRFVASISQSTLSGVCSMCDSIVIIFYVLLYLRRIYGKRSSNKHCLAE